MKLPFAHDGLWEPITSSMNFNRSCTREDIIHFIGIRTTDGIQRHNCLQVAMASLLLVLTFILASGSFAAGLPQPRNSTVHQLIENLFSNYSPRVRPVADWTKTMTVSIDLFVRSVLDVDVQNQTLTTSIWFRQTWTDEFLTWNANTYDGICEVSIPVTDIWVPDIIMVELTGNGKFAHPHIRLEKQESYKTEAYFIDFHGSKPTAAAHREGTVAFGITVGSRENPAGDLSMVKEERSPNLPYVYVNSSGTIGNKKPMQVTSACDLEMFAFPFDTQNCTMIFTSWLHTVKDLDLAVGREYEEKDQMLFMNDGEWELLGVLSRYQIMPDVSGDFARVQFNILIRRRPMIYVVSLLIPSIFLMVVDLMSFYLPANSGTRIIFKTSILVGYTVFRVNIREELPATTLNTPLIGVFFTVCMALLVISLSTSILIIKFFSADDLESRDLLAATCHRRANTGSSHGDQGSEGRTLDSDTDSADGPCVERGGDHAGQGNGPPRPALEAKGLMEEILEEVTLISSSLLKMEDSDLHIYWLSLCHKLDTLLFRVYFFLFMVYTVTLFSLWAAW